LSGLDPAIGAQSPRDVAMLPIGNAYGIDRNNQFSTGAAARYAALVGRACG
jgi:hypothetical protein